MICKFKLKTRIAFAFLNKMALVRLDTFVNENYDRVYC